VSAVNNEFDPSDLMKNVSSWTKYTEEKLAESLWKPSQTFGELRNTADIQFSTIIQLRIPFMSAVNTDCVYTHI